MIDLSGVSHNPAVSEITEVLSNRTQNTDLGFFRCEIAYFLCKLASAMRVSILTKDRGEIPVNMYALALATSGFGKGHSIHVLENEIFKSFEDRFVEETFPLLAESNLVSIATNRSVRNATDHQEELDKATSEFNKAGAYPFTFDSGTAPAVKQLRHKLLLAGAGSINLQIDEIGSNLIGSTELLTLFLELYDQGQVKTKLIKNTADNQRTQDIRGKTPTNMLLFGTPSKLLDGGLTEDQFYDFLTTGYARRCIFGYGHHEQLAFNTLTPEEVFKRLTVSTNKDLIEKWATKFHELADPIFFQTKLDMPDAVSIEMLRYKMECERLAADMAEHEEIRKAEMSHRYFKALKLAGAYAFIANSPDIKMEHLMQAILLVEESGTSFQSILNREKTYVKLAKYIADVGSEVTHADLAEALPFYKSGKGAREEIITLATAWGYKRHIIIKKTIVDGIEFFKGETLEETNINKLIVSWSDDYAYNYKADIAPFDKLHILTQANGLHWCNHHFKDGHRKEEFAIPGFNMIIVDIDGSAKLSVVHELFKEYKFMTYNTKRNTDEENRFRLIIPINYVLKFDHEEYKEFINSFLEWLPFESDQCANQRSKKWLSNNGEWHINEDGEILDVLRFIPKTSKNEKHRAAMKDIESLDNLEKWFASRMETGGRNNQMLKYALALVDSGYSFLDVQNKVLEFNSKLIDPLPEPEIMNTILKTVAKRYTA